MNIKEAMDKFGADLPLLNARGVYPGESVKLYVPDEVRNNFALAMDAIPALTTNANSAVPAFLTTMIDPQVYKILFAANKAAEILGENRKGSWIDETAMFPVVEHTGEVSSYGDFNENGRSGANTNWPQRQSYLFQTVEEIGDRELDRAGLARINWMSEVEGAAVDIMDKAMNLSYFYGVAGLQNYGLLNDPNLSAPLTPSLKSYGGTAWVVNGQIKATANEIYADFQALYLQLVSQSGGLIDQNSKVVVGLSPESNLALTATNSFNVNVRALMKENFTNIRFVNAVQYGAKTAGNPQGYAAGNLVQMIAENVEGQQTGYCSFNEKFRAHPIIRAMSSFRKKVTAGTWGAIIRQPFAIAQMVGV